MTLVSTRKARKAWYCYIKNTAMLLLLSHALNSDDQQPMISMQVKNSL